MNAFTEIMKPFLSTGLTTEQRLTIAQEINVIADSNKKILDIIAEMEDNKKALAMMRGTEKIGEGASQIFMLIS